MFQTFLILFSFSLFPLISNNILFFKFKYEDLNTTNDLSIFQSLFSHHLITTLEIGNPIQKIPLFIKPNEYSFEITSLTIKKDNLTQHHLIYNLSSIFQKYNFFNENKSYTFKTEGCKPSNNMFADHKEDCFSYDTIFIYQDKNMINKIKYDNFNFNMVKNKEENITGVIGLCLSDNFIGTAINFFKILKSNKIINNYNWYFNFDSWNNSNGKLIIGSLPHEDYPNIFSEEDLEYTHIPFDFYSTKIYQIQFDDIYFNQINSTFTINISYKIAELVFDTNIIIGPKELEDKLKEYFFNNFIFEKKCFKDKFKQALHYYTELIFYYCDINIKENLYKILPSIKFVSKDLNFTFEMS